MTEAANHRAAAQDVLLQNTQELARIAGEYHRRARDMADDFYSWGRPANFLFFEQAARRCIRALRENGLFPLENRRIADIGCGSGTWLLEFLQWEALPSHLYGIDLLPDRIARARARLPQAGLHVGSADRLPWEDGSFDLVSQFLMFTSILDPGLKQRIAKEMMRVLKPGGAVLWFDFRVNNPANSHVKGVKTQEIHRLFPGCDIQLTPAILAPPISRKIAARCWPLAEILQSFPFLCTHYIGLIRKP